MYELSLAGAVFVVGFSLWFRPILGLLLFQRYRGPPETGSQRRVRERIVMVVASACIVIAVGTATLTLLW